MSRTLVLSVLCCIAAQWHAMPHHCVANDELTIEPTTVVVKIDDIELKAGKVLVCEGHALTQWWQGEGDDIATQKIIQERLKKHVSKAIQAEMLQGMLHSVRERGGPKKAEAMRPLLEKNFPLMKAALHKQHHLGDWAAKLPETKPYVDEWLSTQVEADLMSTVLAKAWYCDPQRSNEVRAYWEAHREDFSVLRTAQWRQLTLSSSGGTVEEVSHQLSAGMSFKDLAVQYSLDQYRDKGGLVTSDYPHLLVPQKTLDTIQSTAVGKSSQVEGEGKVVFIEVEHVEQSPGEFFEVAHNVRKTLARDRQAEVVKTILSAKRANVRIAWCFDSNN